MHFRLRPILLLLFPTLSLGLTPYTPSAARWTMETPEAMISESARGATARNRSNALPSEEEALARMAIIADLSGRAIYGAGTDALERIARDRDDLAVEARLLSLAQSKYDGSAEGAAKATALGVLEQLAILGPFRDTGGGLLHKDGPEVDGSFADATKRYSWGTVDVSWRAIPPMFATASGLPLDVFISPRKESCTIAATHVHLTDRTSFVISLAAPGEARLMFDSLELGRSSEVHSASLFDRMRGAVQADAGEHLIYAKVCSGAISDSGLVRLRATDLAGKPIALEHDSKLIDPSKAAPVKALAKKNTPLENALSRTGNSAPLARLPGIILRTLAGADDLKSPRAPGLLDEFVRSKDLSADALAVAGWVAPSGANRSGWLGLANERAEKENDKESRGFVTRRIIAQRLQSRMPDWAKRTLDSTPNFGSDQEATVLRAMVLNGLGAEALRLRSYDLLKGVVKDKNASRIALYTYLEQARTYDPSAALLALDELAARGEVKSEWVERSGARGREAILAAAKTLLSHAAQDPSEIESAGNVLSSIGAHTEARGLFSLLATSWSPNMASAWSRLADELHATGENAPLAAIAMQRARELVPTDARTRALLALKKRPQELQLEDERYLVSQDVILARRQGVPPKGTPPTSNERELHWLRAVVMHQDRRVSQLIHYAKEIVVAPRTEDELVEDLPQEGDVTEILRALVHRKDGGTAVPTDEHEDGGRAYIKWPELAPGDTIEVAIRTWTGSSVGGRGDPPYYFMDFGGAPSTHPLLYNEVIVESRKDQPIFVDVISGKADKKEETDRGDTHITRLVWEKPNVIQDEPLAPPMSETVPVVVGSTFRDWAAFRTWYAEAVRGFTEPDAQVRRLAADLTKGKTSRDEKLKAIFNFVSDNIRYVNYVSAEAWLPNRPQQLLARREGDCDDKALLLITLLRAVGIEAQEVLVQTRETGQPSVLKAKGAAVPLFDHGIAFLPGPNGGTYLDATSPQSRLGPIPSMDARAVALRMDSGPPEIVSLPASSPADHGSEVQWDIKLQSDGAAILKGKELHVGDGAFFLRSFLSQEDSRRQYVEENLLSPWLPGSSVEKTIGFKGDLPDGKASVEYDARAAAVLREEPTGKGVELVFPLNSSSPLAAQLAPLVTRTLPVWLPSSLAPSHQKRTIRFHAPKGTSFLDLPTGGEVNGGVFGRAELKIRKEGKDTVVVERNLSLDANVIAPDKYPAWRSFLQEVDTLMRKSLRLRKDAP